MINTTDFCYRVFDTQIGTLVQKLPQEHEQ